MRATVARSKPVGIRPIRGGLILDDERFYGGGWDRARADRSLLAADQFSWLKWCCRFASRHVRRQREDQPTHQHTVPRRRAGFWPPVFFLENWPWPPSYGVDVDDHPVAPAMGSGYTRPALVIRCGACDSPQRKSGDFYTAGSTDSTFPVRVFSRPRP